MKFKIVLLFIFSMYLVGCAQKPMTQGDKMLAASDQAKELSHKWNEGNKLSLNGSATQNTGTEMVSEGRAQVEKGEKLIAQGNEMNQNGRQQSRTGKKLQQETESDFDEKFSESASTN